MNKIVIAGGTGFLGQFLTSKFRCNGYKVIVISRSKGDILWDDGDGIKDALEEADVLINLAGKSVDCRYNEKNKSEILRSRVETTRILGESIMRCNHPPKVWINSSTATIYRHAEDRPMTEANGETGKGFSVTVAQQWEKTFFDFKAPDTRQVALRMAIVLGNQGGALPALKRLIRFGLGGKQGNGKQMFSWVHIEDIYRIIIFLIDHKALTGAFNCSSPNPVSNSAFMKTCRQVLKSKNWSACARLAA